jgi:hypothetical protein
MEGNESGLPGRRLELMSWIGIDHMPTRAMEIEEEAAVMRLHEQRLLNGGVRWGD